MIQADNLAKHYRYHTKKEGLMHSFFSFFAREKAIKKAVDGISFSIDKGEIVGFLGPNGAGKTTTLKMLSGILTPTSGEISVDGYIPQERKDDFKRRIAVILGNKSQLWPDLPAVDSFTINKHIYDIDTAKYRKTVHQLTEMFGLGDLLHTQVRRLSLGERMKMELVASLLHEPDIILLDEPTIGLDLISQKSIREFILRYNREKQATIIITSHYTADIEALCKRVVIINHGKLVYDGEIDKIDTKMNAYKIIQVKSSHISKHQLRTTTPGLISIQGQEFDYRLTVEREKLPEVIHMLSSLPDIQDINISEYPIEKQIENVFSHSNKGGKGDGL